MINKLKSQNSNLKTSNGFALISVLVVMIILISIGTLFISIASYEMKITRNLKNSTKAFYLAEAGVEKAIWELNRTRSAYTGETNTPLEGGKFTVNIDNHPTDPNKKIITSIGYYPANNTFPAVRKIILTASPESSQESVAFNYAVQIGDQGLTMNSNSTINGNVYSNGNITGYSNSRITGDAYAVGTISSPRPTVSGIKQEHADSQPLPVVDIEFWKTQANINNDPYIGNYIINGTENLGPRKIEGSFTMNSNSKATLQGPLYVTGNFILNSNSKLYLDEAFGSKGTVIIVDGTITVNSNSYIYPTSSSPKGYIMLLSTSTSDSAINSNGAGGIFYCPNGGITINSNGHAVSVAARRLTINSNGSLTYDIGLASSIFTTGPGGSWVPETETWNEVY